MTRLAWLALATIAGCTKTDPLFCKENPDRCTDGGVPIDASGNGTMDGAPVCLGAGKYELCVAAPTSPVAITPGATIDTTMDGGVCASTQPDKWGLAGQLAACFVIGTDVTIADAIVTGSRPIVFAATGTLTVTGHLDAAGRQNLGKAGPGAPSALCSFTRDPIATASGGGGAAGGSFRTGGGDGGRGNDAVGSNGSPMGAAPTPSVLRAGCTGQSGGAGVGNGGSGGPGGGAVFLVAGTMIDLRAGAIINASGGGGGGGATTAGGGGGGSGGMIVLRAPSISAAQSAILVANGGGGGAGGGALNAGVAGNDPNHMTPPTAALGGMRATGTGASGAAGSAGGSPPDNGSNGASNEGGGGGGGAGGRIESSAALGTTLVSPPVVIVP